MAATFLGGEIVYALAGMRSCARVLLIDDFRVGRYPCSGCLRRRSLRWQLLHLHLEHKSWAFVHAVRDNIDLPTAVLNNLLTYRQTHAKSVWIWILSALQFAEQSEQLIQLFLCNSFACIFHMHLQLLLNIVVSNNESDTALARKLECVLSEVD